MAEVTIKKRVELDKADLDWFQETFGAYGALSWFIRACIQEARRSDPHLNQLVARALKKLAQEEG